ncbi:hypothetical protein L6R52_03185 [Myxococcota bacterium]|nr:hypothetical protein [Myxococcota bacterium]
MGWGIAVNDPISRVSYLLGHVRGLFLPFGLFALVAVGVHVGCDRLDDQAFVALSALDAIVDAALAATVRAIGDLFSASPASIEAWTYRAVDLVDVDAKQWLARWIAVGLELFTDLVLALPVFLHRELPASARALGALVKKSLADPTVLRVAAPIASACACVAGAFAVSREAQVLAHSAISGVAVMSEHRDLATLSASITGYLALCVVLWRLGAVVVLGALTYADKKAARDALDVVGSRKRRLRGWVTALVALPITITAVVATPIAGTLRALLWL